MGVGFGEVGIESENYRCGGEVPSEPEVLVSATEDQDSATGSGMSFVTRHEIKQT